MKTLYLHIGSPRTGTTSIQHFCHVNKDVLEEKGYSCEVKVENRRKKQDFVQDFLERENPPGKLQRYSFDVKA